MDQPLTEYGRGAAVATDLINSSGLVRRTTGEQLDTPTALAGFLAEHDISPRRRPTQGDLDRVHRLRQHTRSLVLDADEQHLMSGASALLARAGTQLTVAEDRDGQRQWAATVDPEPSVTELLSFLIGVGLLGALRALGHDRFRSCASPVCDGAFVDTTRAGRRRYCMPELCGNRVNVAKHRARRTSRGA
jgi:predicted RNA-binding Zn ribbon-like protein